MFRWVAPRKHINNCFFPKIIKSKQNYIFLTVSFCLVGAVEELLRRYMFVMKNVISLRSFYASDVSFLFKNCFVILYFNLILRLLLSNIQVISHAKNSCRKHRRSLDSCFICTPDSLSGKEWILKFPRFHLHNKNTMPFRFTHRFSHRRSYIDPMIQLKGSTPRSIKLIVEITAFAFCHFYKVAKALWTDSFDPLFSRVRGVSMYFALHNNTCSRVWVYCCFIQFDLFCCSAARRRS